MDPYTRQQDVKIILVCVYRHDQKIDKEELRDLFKQIEERDSIEPKKYAMMERVFTKTLNYCLENKYVRLVGNEVSLLKDGKDLIKDVLEKLGIVQTTSQYILVFKIQYTVQNIVMQADEEIALLKGDYQKYMDVMQRPEVENKLKKELTETLNKKIDSKKCRIINLRCIDAFIR